MLNNGKKWIYMLVGGLLAVGLIAGAGFLYLQGEAAGREGPGSPGAMWFGQGDPPGDKYEEALADALGISVETLRSAYDAIWEANVEAAVNEGLLTEAQAERILEREGAGFRIHRGPLAPPAEMNARLAEELGISQATLESAQETAHQALLTAAIESGELSEEQVELMQARQALAPYMQAALADAFEQAVTEALSEGAITQAQADLLLEAGHPGMRFSPMGPGPRVHDNFPGGRFFGAGASQ